MPTPPLRGATRAARAPSSRRRVVLLVVAGAVVVAGAITVAMLTLSDRAVRHSYDVAWPKDEPRGDPVAVNHAVKAGDVFLSTWRSKAHIVLSTDDVIDPKQGMSMSVQYLVAHGVDRSRDGKGLESTVKVLLERVESNVPDVQSAVFTAVGTRSDAFTLVVPRDSDGRLDRLRAVLPPLHAMRRAVLDKTLAGLGDAVTNWLPQRDVRLGEVWHADEAADLPGVEDVVRFVARTTGEEGFPPADVKGRVQAEAIEEKDGEDCLRLRVVIAVHHEGDVVAPAMAGWLSTAAKIEGRVWVSRVAGVVWAAEFQSVLTSSYLTPKLPSERRAEQTIAITTRRAAKMPD